MRSGATAACLAAALLLTGCGNPQGAKTGVPGHPASNAPRVPAQTKDQPPKPGAPTAAVVEEIWKAINDDAQAGYPQDLSKYESGPALQVGQVTQYQEALAKTRPSGLGALRDATVYTQSGDDLSFLAYLKVATGQGDEPEIAVFRRRDKQSDWKLDFRTVLRANTLPAGMTDPGAGDPNHKYTQSATPPSIPALAAKNGAVKQVSAEQLAARPEDVEAAYASLFAGAAAPQITGDFGAPYASSDRRTFADLGAANGNLSTQLLAKPLPPIQAYPLNSGGALLLFAIEEDGTLRPAAGQCIVAPGPPDPTKVTQAAGAQISPLLMAGRYSQVVLVKTDMVAIQVPAAGQRGPSTVVGFQGDLTAANGMPCR